MADRPKVSAVMIFLDAEKYIAEAIDSILAQSYANWELILLDDGSTDTSTAIAKRYAAQHADRIRYAEHDDHENRGMSASRNRGVSLGTGEYISFLDSDDVWLPERLEHFVAIAEAFPQAGMVYGPTLYWFSWAKERGIDPPVPGQEDFAGHLDLPADTLIPPLAPLRQFLASGGACLPGICSLLIRRDAYESIGGFEPSFRGLYEDQVFLSKMVMHHPVVITDQVLDRYRQHSESCCYRAITTGEYHPMDLHPARLRYLRWLQQYCRNRNVRDPSIRRALRTQIGHYRFPWLTRGLRTVDKGIRFAGRRLASRLTPTAYERLKSLYDRITRVEA